MCLMCLCVDARTPLCSILAVFGDLPAEHGIHFLDQLQAQVFNPTADLSKHHLAVQVSSLHGGKQKKLQSQSQSFSMGKS